MIQIYSLLLIFFLCVFQLNAQVTIGSNHRPEKGALLQIKDIEPDNTNLTSATNITATKGGLVLPRVALTKINSLEPFLVEEEQTYTAKLLHVGLMVYNINVVDNEKLLPGIYVWDGDKWSVSGSGVSGNVNGCVDKNGIEDADCDGYNKEIDPDDSDPCTPQTKVEIQYVEDGVVKALNDLTEITVKRGTHLTLQLKSLLGNINKQKWSTGSSGKSIEVNTKVEDLEGKEYWVMANNCPSEGEALRKIVVKVSPNPCLLTISGGSPFQQFELGSPTNPFTPINISVDTRDNIILNKISSEYPLGTGIFYNIDNQKPTISIDKGVNPTTPGFIKLTVRSSNEECNNDESKQEILVTYGSKTPKVRILITKYKQTQNYTSNNAPNIGEITIDADIFENSEYVKEKGILIKTYRSNVHPPLPEPVRGGSFNLYDGANMDGFINHPLENENSRYLINNVSSNETGDRMIILAYVKGIDDLYFYSQPRYITACEYNFSDIRKCSLASERVSNWGFAGAPVQWMQWEVNITSGKKGDGYNRDGNNVGTYRAVNILTYPNRNEIGKYDWWFAQNVYNEHPDLIYGGLGQYSAPGVTPISSNPWVVFVNVIGTDPTTDTERKMAERYGFLYKSELFTNNVSWYDSLCPLGWHGATETDWTSLLNTVQDLNKPLESAFINAGANMKIVDDYAINQNGLWNQATTNTKKNYLGLSILPAGNASWGYGRDNQGVQASFFSMKDAKTFFNRNFTSTSNDVVLTSGTSYQGRSIRCVK